MDGEAKYSILERYGENYTEKEYITNPAIGRDQQIKDLILILLTPEKSAILVGKPGIGKTAIVEGLAYAIQRKEVPNALLGYTIINIKTASLLGTMANGESKVQVMIDELKEKEKIILFIDEIHMLIGATDESALDFANIFKEGLGRGSIKVIGATTTEEYERYILRDKAFTRRFQKVEVPEPTRDETVKILMGTLPKIEKNTGVKMKYSKYQQELIMGFIVDLTSEYKRVFEVGSRYPDIALTLMKSAFSFTVFDNRKEVDIHDFEKAILNTHLVYPDVIKKEIPIFKEKFKDIYNNEDLNISYETNNTNNNLNYNENELNKNIVSSNEQYNSSNSNNKVEYMYGSPTTITEMGTRDIRVKPVVPSTNNYNSDLTNGVILTPEEVKEENSTSLFDESPVVEETEKKYNDDFKTKLENNDDINSNKPFREAALRRDTVIPRQTNDTSALDSVLLNNVNNKAVETSLNLNLDDYDDIDNKDDDFYDRDE